MARRRRSSPGGFAMPQVGGPGGVGPVAFPPLQAGPVPQAPAPRSRNGSQGGALTKGLSQAADWAIAKERQKSSQEQQTSERGATENFLKIQAQVAESNRFKDQARRFAHENELLHKSKFLSVYMDMAFKGEITEAMTKQFSAVAMAPDMTDGDLFDPEAESLIDAARLEEPMSDAQRAEIERVKQKGSSGRGDPVHVTDVKNALSQILLMKSRGVQGKKNKEEAQEAYSNYVEKFSKAQGFVTRQAWWEFAKYYGYTGERKEGPFSGITSEKDGWGRHPPGIKRFDRKMIEEIEQGTFQSGNRAAEVFTYMFPGTGEDVGIHSLLKDGGLFHVGGTAPQEYEGFFGTSMDPDVILKMKEKIFRLSPLEAGVAYRGLLAAGNTLNVFASKMSVTDKGEAKRAKVLFDTGGRMMDLAWAIEDNNPGVHYHEKVQAIDNMLKEYLSASFNPEMGGTELLELLSEPQEEFEGRGLLEEITRYSTEQEEEAETLGFLGAVARGAREGPNVQAAIRFGAHDPFLNESSKRRIPKWYMEEEIDKVLAGTKALGFGLLPRMDR